MGNICISARNSVSVSPRLNGVEANIHGLKNDLKKLSDYLTIKTSEKELQQPTEAENIMNLLLSRVAALEQGVDRVKRKTLKEEILNDLCCGGMFHVKPNYTSSRKPEVDELEDIQYKKASPVENEKKPEGVAFERLESKFVGLQPMLDQVLSCVMREEVRVIGLYGMGGVGKTTLLKQIAELLQAKQYCDFVIFVEVSRDLRVERIQDEIGEKIGLFNDLWAARSLEQKASDILDALRIKKFVLLLDDIWERVDLTQVGVPLPAGSTIGNCKIIFTTRLVEICSLMEADIHLRVKCLENGSALRLFKISNTEDEIFHDQSIVQKCGGLPLALTVVGQEMAKKPSSEQQQKAYRHWVTSPFPGMVDKVYSSLKLSYDGLRKEIFRTCLLYCCLFPSQSRIPKRNLIDYWIGEGFLDDRLGAQNQGYYIIKVLLDACLLEEEFDQDEDYVKLHVVVYDMLLWIASELETEKQIFIVTRDAIGLEAAPIIKKWEDIRRMSVVEDIENLTEIPKCPHLQTLFLNNKYLKILGEGFSELLPSLKVLNLSNNSYLADFPSSIAKLVSLQYLDLSVTGIEELSTEMKSLVNLKCLNLERTFKLSRIPRQLISNFSKLHVLRLLACSFLSSDGAEWLIEELLGLKSLDMLSITLESSHAVQRLLSSTRLKNCTQSLCLQFLHHPKSLKVSLTDLKHLNTLIISDCMYLEELKVDCGGEVLSLQESHCFCSLQVVTLRSCPKLQDLTWLILARNLRSLQVSNCSDMEEIINVGRFSEFPEMMRILIPFSKLKFLTLQHLPNLMSIYWSYLPLADLTEISITECPKLNLFPPHFNDGKEPEIVEQEQ